MRFQAKSSSETRSGPSKRIYCFSSASPTMVTDARDVLAFAQDPGLVCLDPPSALPKPADHQPIETVEKPLAEQVEKPKKEEKPVSPAPKAVEKLVERVMEKSLEKTPEAGVRHDDEAAKASEAVISSLRSNKRGRR